MSLFRAVSVHVVGPAYVLIRTQQMRGRVSGIGVRPVLQIAEFTQQLRCVEFSWRSCSPLRSVNKLVAIRAMWTHLFVCKCFLFFPPDVFHSDPARPPSRATDGFSDICYFYMETIFDV